MCRCMPAHDEGSLTYELIVALWTQAAGETACRRATAAEHEPRGLRIVCACGGWRRGGSGSQTSQCEWEGVHVLDPLLRRQRDEHAGK